MTSPTYLTQVGLDKIREELHDLKTKKRKEIAWRIQEAKELGDLSENAEYSEAKNAQAFIEGRIAELEQILKSTVIIDETTPRDTVSIGTTIAVEFDDARKQTFTIVGSNEADPALGKISNESPLGKAFLGHKVGEVVTLAVPKGSATATILSIQ
jgi:transcription elongation factor GreA